VRNHRRIGALLAGFVVVIAWSAFAGAAAAQDVRVSAGSPTSPFSANKQNEPAVAVDAANPTVLAAGANDNIDMEACNAGADNTCPFTPGVGVSGIYFSFDSGASWVQPTYQGLTARNCTGAVGADPDCVPQVGPIGTLPNYVEAGLSSGGDPAVAWGPRPTAGGGFSFDDGSRLYYANLAAAIPGAQPFKGAEAVAVSHTDDPVAAAAGSNAAWSAPVIASRQSGAQFSDKEQIWADNAASSPFFGNVYVCYAAFRGNGNGFTNQPLAVLTSRDGGDRWTQKQVTPAANNINGRNGFGRSGCTVRTDSAGVVYVFVFQFGFSATTAAPGQIQLIKSFDGGAHWGRPQAVATAVDTCNFFEASIGRCVEDGVGGARSDLSPAPSVDIANGAPTGGDASDRIALTWVDGRAGLNHEQVMFTTSTNGGASWTAPAPVQQGADRGYYSAPAISPDGTDVYLVYNAFTEPFKDSAEGPANDRPLVGVLLHANAGAGGVGPFTQVHRGAAGDARASSQNNLAAEFLGDYVYAAATRDYGTAVWNDVRAGSDCPAIDEFRQELHEEAVATGEQTADAEEPLGAEGREHGDRDQGEDEPAVAPAVQQECPATFGNSDIFGVTVGDPTP
jgi:hypothetical protein